MKTKVDAMNKKTRSLCLCWISAVSLLPVFHCHAQDNKAKADEEKPQVEWNFDLSAFKGMPESDYKAAQKLVEKAVELLGSNIESPTRPEYHMGKRYHKLGNFMAGNFRYEAPVFSTKQVPIEIAIYPKVESVKKLKSRSSAERGVTLFYTPGSRSRWPNAVYCTKYGVSGNVGLYVKSAGFTQIGKISIPYDKEIDFSAAHLKKLQFEEWKGAVETGRLTTSRIVTDNKKLIKVAYEKSDGTLESWIAFSVIDANGAWHKRGYVGRRGRYLQRDLHDAQYEMKHDVHSLLCIPLPMPADWRAGPHEVWALNEKYAEHEVPIWTLHATKNSPAWKEQFHLNHISVDCKQDIWQLMVFANAKPEDLAEALKKIQVKDN